jgi:hypothetical protein
LDDPLVGEGGIVLVHPTCGPTQVSQSWMEICQTIVFLSTVLLWFALELHGC